MEAAAWLGLVIGATLGAVYGLLQRRQLRRGAPAGLAGLLPGAVGRLVLLVVALWLAWQFSGAHRGWLAGSLLVAYTVVFLAYVKELIFTKK
jgi:drug/metabolite transporter (DMT)-like permease